MNEFKCTFQDCIEKNGIECADQLRELLLKERRRFRDVYEIFIEICKVTGFDQNELSGRYRGLEQVYARHAFAKIVKDIFPDTSLTEIGKPINRDHATVLHYLRQTDEVKEKNLAYKRIKAKLNL
jgi:chromosomal replication initiation ATPase DnaA